MNERSDDDFDNVSDSGEGIPIDRDSIEMGTEMISPAKIERPKELSLQIPSEVDGDINAVPPTPSLLVPCLRGKMSYEGGTVICKGLWAMSEAAHAYPAQCSEFEFKLVKADDESTGSFPVSGKYQGWFSMKQPPPLKGSVKVDDKEIYLAFAPASVTVPSDEDPDIRSYTHNIHGKGTNKFGSFNLHGTLDEEGHIQIFREYYHLTPTPGASSHKKKSSHPSAASTPGADRKGGVGRPAQKSQSVEKSEPTPRIRKQMSLDEGVPAPAAKATFSSKQASKQPLVNTAPTPTSAGSNMFADRSHRVTGAMKKCLELLKELSKHPLAVWFLEPVDPVKLGIPDYPQIISRPMDFKTIRTFIETGTIETAESFAEHVRLVFNNAVTFNQLKENPVHIAAMEMSGRFEDKFRILQSQLGADYRSKSMDDLGTTPRPVSAGLSGGSFYPKKNKFGTGRLSIATGASAKFLKPGSLGPRQTVASAFMPPSIDPSALQILEMQREMEVLKEELRSLRAQVREQEITQRVNETKEAAHNPLTFEEKKTLIAQIHKLPSQKMEQVLEIVQAAYKSDDQENGNEEIEVPLDSLDTLTLRKLQKFIEENNIIDQKKRRGFPNGFDQKDEKRPKKPKVAQPKNRPAKGSTSRGANPFAVRPAVINDPLGSNGFPLEDSFLNDDTAELLFSHDDEEEFSDFEMDNGNKESTEQIAASERGVPGKDPSILEAHKADRGEIEEDIEELIVTEVPSVGGKGVHSIEITNSSAWVSTSAQSSVDSGKTEVEDNSDLWRHTAEEIRLKKLKALESKPNRID